ncbi:hypothetical protein [Leptolyngbya sp. NIES-2104]|uniref:hypothetical protein n=1 Tax=Leptolyngbya sp. NIES-2104 TaxID=1552121 RepID=UPI0006EC5CD9|nr:hypothetical protein [Leptolyngbya sp. NIES-2104]GAP97536.1 hypothetical protein NIES2104_40830 [Leptolyngbya sp. NIES-2104]
MLRDKVKQEIDRLNEDQLKQVEGFIASIKHQAEKPQALLQSWNAVTPEEWVKSFQEWTAHLPKTGVSLPDEAFDRESIYGDRGSISDQ